MSDSLKPGSNTETAKKPSKLTSAQLSDLSLAKRSDGLNDDWVELYRAEFPPEELRDVAQLKEYITSGRVVLHETRDKSGQLLTMSMSQDYPADPDTGEPSFWLGCWTVTRPSAQSTGIGRTHFAAVLEALKAEKADYIGRFTEIESTEGTDEKSQEARRARFYQSLSMVEVDVPYEIPLYQPLDCQVYLPQSELGRQIKGQLLFSPFSDRPLNGEQLRSIIRRVCIYGYNVAPDDPYIATRLAPIDDRKANLLVPVRIHSTSAQPTASQKTEAK